jgi:hypothetical protein
MTDIILRRESRRLERTADAMIWDGFSTSMRLLITMANIKEIIGAMTLSSVGWAESIKAAVLALRRFESSQRRCPLWWRIWLAICFWIEDLFKGGKNVKR